MVKSRKNTSILSIVIALILIFSMSIRVSANMIIPNNMVIATENNYLYQVEYEDFYIKARKITSEDKKNVGYCLEIDREYPSGENFVLLGDPIDVVNGVLNAGYPNKTYQELNLDNEEQAYFATQIVIWSVIEGYDVYKFKGDNPKIINAIRSIHDNGVNGVSKPTGKYIYKEYDTNNVVQDIVMVLNNDGAINEENGINRSTVNEEGIIGK
ncbi:thioester domain-containing protein [Clostridium sp.]|uniref:thioester domain-containing protein n=1 Tax=Clostridium sp. TaxID=1506 RepID=UPI003F2F1AD8